MKQLIIARKDLHMSPGKLAAQVAHGAMAFLTRPLKNMYDEKATLETNGSKVKVSLAFPKDIYEQWICGSFAKVVCEAKNKNQLLKAVTIAEEMGLEEGRHFFLIRDNCLTELEPEDEDGRTLTCIGFIPMDDERMHQISKKYQLYT